MTVDMRLIYERDGFRCPHCGHRADSIQHRANRQMGGSRAAAKHAPSNLLAMCWISNVSAESDSVFAEQAKEYGWKLTQNQDPLTTPFFDVISNCWYEIDDQFNRTPVY